MALSADGQAALVGAPFAGGSGAAYLYHESAAAGPRRRRPASPAAGEGLGSSVALSADDQAALVGASVASSGFGAAYLYDESAGAWPTTPTASFAGSGGEARLLGGPVGRRPGRPGGGAVRRRNGAAYLYHESAGAWPTTPTASFAGSGGEDLGWSVALSADGQAALVGAPSPARATAPPTSTMSRPGPGPPPRPASPAAGARPRLLGGASADGQAALVGAPAAILGGGTANVYTEAGGRWHTSPVAAFRGGSGEGLGSSVALSADGQAALVGADNPAYPGGAAFVYTSPR